MPTPKARGDNAISRQSVANKGPTSGKLLGIRAIWHFLCLVQTSSWALQRDGGLCCEGQQWQPAGGASSGPIERCRLAEIGVLVLYRNW